MSTATTNTEGRGMWGAEAVLSAEAAGLQSDVELETEAVQELFAELEDEEFTESVDRLVQEGAARYALSLRRWAGDADASSIAAGRSVAQLPRREHPLPGRGA